MKKGILTGVAAAERRLPCIVIRHLATIRCSSEQVSVERKAKRGEKGRKKSKKVEKVGKSRKSGKRGEERRQRAKKGEGKAKKAE